MTDHRGDPMLERPFRHLCPEADMRDAMTDDEFWAHVAINLAPDPDEYDPADLEALDVAIAQNVCDECGATGACAWDAEGRPLIHAATPDTEETR